MGEGQPQTAAQAQPVSFAPPSYASASSQPQQQAGYGYAFSPAAVAPFPVAQPMQQPMQATTTTSFAFAAAPLPLAATTPSTQPMQTTTTTQPAQDEGPGACEFPDGCDCRKFVGQEAQKLVCAAMGCGHWVDFHKGYTPRM